MKRPTRRELEKELEDLKETHDAEEPPAWWMEAWDVPPELWDDPAEAWAYGISGGDVG